MMGKSEKDARKELEATKMSKEELEHILPHKVSFKHITIVRPLFL